MTQVISLLSTLISFLLGFSCIAAIHELGHLLIAKWCGIQVNRYMVFFPPKLLSWRWGETEYGLGSIPLGGFVEIQGMGEDTTEDPKKIAASDFRKKPAWQRALVMVGGILFNLLSAFLLIACLLIVTGTPYLSKEGLNMHGIAPTTLGLEAGFVRGDKIIQVNGHDFLEVTELEKAMQQKTPLTYTVQRDGKQFEVIINNDAQQQLQEGKAILFTALAPYKIKKVQQGSAADQAGLTPEDRILSINGKPTPYLEDLHKVLQAHPGAGLTIVYEREAKTLTSQVTLPKEAKLGIETVMTLPMEYKRYGVGAGFLEAGHRVANIAKLQVLSIKKIITREVSFFASVQSPIIIAGMFNSYEGFSGFLWLVAFLSIILALMNLLPIPALDGFHLLINLGEVITRRKISPKWYTRIQTAGAAFLLLLTVVLIFKDLYKLFVGT